MSRPSLKRGPRSNNELNAEHDEERDDSHVSGADGLGRAIGRDRLHVTPLVVQLPVGREQEFSGVIDLVETPEVSAAARHRTMAAGRRSITAFQTRRATS